MLLHAALDRQLKKKGVDVDICREVLVMEMVIFWVIAMVMTEVMMMLMILTRSSTIGLMQLRGFKFCSIYSRVLSA